MMISYLPFLSWFLLSTQVEERALDAPPPVVEEPWTISIGMYAFDPPDEDAYVSPILRADRGSRAKGAGRPPA